MKLIHRSAFAIAFALALTAGVFAAALSSASAAPVKQSVRPGFWDRLGQKWLPSNRDALRFNEEILNSRKDMETAMGNWFTAVNTALSFQASNGSKRTEITESVAALRKAQADLETVTKKTIDKTKDIKAHELTTGKESDSGKSLKTAQLKFLEGQLDVIKKDFAAVTSLVENYKLEPPGRFASGNAVSAAAVAIKDERVLDDNGVDKADLAERFKKAKEHLAAARAYEKEQVKEIVKLQIAFAKEFNVD